MVSNTSTIHWGHDVGDSLLKYISFNLKKIINEKNFFGRLGGDEFVIIVPNVESVEEVSKKIIRFFENDSFQFEGYECCCVTTSIGISIYNSETNEKTKDLLKYADIALYRAKEEGKNQYQFFSSLVNVDSYKKFTMRNSLKKALKNEEFVIHYQPRFDPVTYKLLAAEALVRWKNREWGIVSPNEFIPLLEETTLIVPFGEWLIKKVCLQIKEWEEKGIPVKKISINLSPMQLFQVNFIENFASILGQTKIDAKLIEFEITENIIINKEEQALLTLSKIKDLGVSFALDDFGTGYSALNYLRRFPCDIIKLDKSIIVDIEVGNESYEIAAAIIKLCKKLNKIVVAEGVETKKQLSLLQELKCDEIQGFLFSPPIGQVEFENFLLNKEKIETREGKYS